MSQKKLLSEIESLLVTHIPVRVKAAKIKEPVYSLRVWFHGSDTYGPDRTPGLMLPKESWRVKVLAEKGAEAPPFLWCADELDGDGMSLGARITDRKIKSACRQWYAQRYSDPNDGMEEVEALEPFRKAMQRVCRKLNKIQWQALATVTDDFVVFPADWSHSFMDDYGEMLASIPKAKLDRLNEQNLLTPTGGTP